MPTLAQAEGEFNVDATVTYSVQPSGKTIVTHNITLENNFSTLYATTYTLSLENIDTANVSAVDGSGKPLEITAQKDGDKTEIKVSFKDAVVGKNAKRHFSISYENGSFAVRTGEIWEISIPRLTSDSAFRSYTVVLLVPSSFGLEAYISPKADSSEETNGEKKYVFSKDQIGQTGITAGFGAFQVFSFNLLYHLENPLNRTAETQIALPPDTSFQKIYLQKIDPKPSSVVIDSDGNWIATYKMSARQRIDITVLGSVQIFASYRSFPQPTPAELSDNLKETEYWQVNDPKIKSLANQLKTPRSIYDYVSQNLKYNFDRVQPNVVRMGATNALKNPDLAICMEFTDLFVAIARAAGIPAREVNGYAYTENPEIQPLSLVADVLHSWPEYYDKTIKAWIPVDPTWGSTTGGEDFFSKLDLRHFAFVIHGKDSTKPYAPGSYKLGPNPQKDVFVSFGKLPETRTSIPILTVVDKRMFPFLDSVYTVEINNPGPVALYSIYPTVFFDNNINNRDFIVSMPPYSSTKMEVKVPFSLLGKNTPNTIKIVVLGSEIQIQTNKTQVVVNSLLVLFAVFFIILLLVLIKLKKITFTRFTDKIRILKAKIYEEFNKKFNKNSTNP
ncbi:MAG TPA: transglutaminase-like domain-containing protein [Patescibacteria group bacterium]|nr:transglutaminase-like domain-containing protein [Patescibacteria group bacterium]